MSFKITDKTGKEFWASIIQDINPNPDGWYCEIYADDFLARKIDDMVVHPEDIYGYDQLDGNGKIEAATAYITATYAQLELDPEFIF